MGSRKKIFGQVRLKSKEKKLLKEMTTKGEHPALILNRTRIVLLLDKGKGSNEIADSVGCGRVTANRIERRYLNQGLDETFCKKANH